MAKTGLDDYLLAHTVDEFIALPELDLDDPLFDGMDEWYSGWKLRKDAALSGESDARGVARIASHRRDDIGNGERFVDGHGHDVKWSNELGWRHYNGKYWEEKEGKAMTDEEFKEFVELVKDMRQTQRDYFAFGAVNDLNRAKQLEKIVDRKIAAW